MRISTNVTSQTALRHTDNRLNEVNKSIRQLASGHIHNSAADSPGEVYLADILKNLYTGMNQTYKNNEQSASLFQVAEGGLAEVVGVLTELKQLAVHAANEAANDKLMVEADQLEIEQKLQTLDSIARNTSFGSIKLLDGSMGANGTTVGDNLSFVSANQYTPPSPEKGYIVDIHQASTRARFEGKIPLSVENIGDGIQIIVNEFETLDAVNGRKKINENSEKSGGTQGKFAKIDSRFGELKEQIAQIQKNYQRDPDAYPFEQMSKEVRTLVMYYLNKEFEESGMEMEIFESPDQRLVMRHKEFGDGHSFSVTCNVPGVLTERPMVAEDAMEGLNVEGTIAGYSAVGKGQYLTAREGTPAQGVQIRYDRELDYIELPVFDEMGNRVGSTYKLEPQEMVVGAPMEGFVHISQGSKDFYLDSNQGIAEPFSFISVRSNRLGQNVRNESDFNSLADIDVTDIQGARDAQLLIEKAIGDVSKVRADVGSFQKNTIEKTLGIVAQGADNLESSASTLRDTDVAEAMSRLTRDEIMTMTGQVALAQANQKPRTVLGLIRG
ncbi:MAG: flagellin [Deltaproteobacteria bacterium]